MLCAGSVPLSPMVRGRQPSQHFRTGGECQGSEKSASGSLMFVSTDPEFWRETDGLGFRRGFLKTIREVELECELRLRPLEVAPGCIPPRWCLPTPWPARPEQ